jgi:ABC-type branched-subunit amino acid transport system ATPase component
LRTADGRRTIVFAESREDAEKLRVEQQKLLDAIASGADLAARDGRWLLENDQQELLANYDSEADGRAVVDPYRSITQATAARRRDAWIVLALGIALGAAGSWTVWHRARRTPEVISLAGIARTFQNIRLFQNMTVLENVLTAMDRSLPGGVVRMALQTPKIRRQEARARERARELLNFVSLGGRESMLAKNLPYGDQRRLEIARALATEPQLILLDEPAAGMNPTESLDLNGLIERIRRQGLTVMLIEHHMKVVMGISDRIAVLDYGQKIAEGTPEEVRANPQVIAAYLGSEEVH